jgi:hypothetical protein
MVKLLSAKVCAVVALGVALLWSAILHPPDLDILASDAYRDACNKLADAVRRQSQIAPPQGQGQGPAELE